MACRRSQGGRVAGKADSRRPYGAPCLAPAAAAPQGAPPAPPPRLPRYVTKRGKCGCAGGYGGDGTTCTQCPAGFFGKGGSLKAKCRACKAPKVTFDGIKCAKPRRRLLGMGA